jgi:hypothetical protein
MQQQLISVPRSGCPFVALQIKGRHPFTVSRERFVKATKGVNVTDCSLDQTEQGYRLTVTHRTGNVRGKYVFYDQSNSLDAYRKIRKQINDWADRQRMSRLRKQTAAANPLPLRYQKQIAKLQRELKRIGDPYMPRLRDESPSGASQWERDRFASWIADKPKRKQAAKIAGMVLKNHVTDSTGYKMLRDAGFEVKTRSQMSADQKRRFGGPYNYWINLPVILHLASKPNKFDYGYADPSKRNETWLRNAKDYFHTKRQIESINAQISAFRTMDAVIAEPEISFRTEAA